MVRRILAIVLVVLGLAAIGGAVLSTTAWRSSDTVTASLAEAPDAPLLVVEPGVLDVVDEDVTIHAEAQDAESRVVLVIARDLDVEGWIGTAPYVSVTGLSEWTTLAATSVTGEEQELPDPAVSDMWYAVEEGTGEATLEFTVPEGRWVVLAATDGAAPAPSIDLSWPQEVTTPFFLPGLIAGGVLVVLGLGWLVLQVVGGRRRAASSAAGGPVVATLPVPPDAKSAESPAAGTPAVGTPAVGTPAAGTPAAGVDGLTDTALTRRQLREAAAAEAAAQRKRGRRRGAEEPAQRAPEADDATAVIPALATGDEPVSPEASEVPADAGETGEALDLAAAAPETADAPSSYPEWMQGSGEDAEAGAVVTNEVSAAEATEAGAATAEEQPGRRRWFGRRRAKPTVEEAAPGDESGARESRSWDPATWAAPTIGAQTEGEPATEQVAEPVEGGGPGAGEDGEDNGRASEWRRAWGLPVSHEDGADADAAPGARTDEEEQR